eukprot:TRINITY_DN1699_c0_g1_i2.p1 TRINITY_DN1699_c0_g1~~TRINITY_DN1699_c0_g1_i2.p1  ORF type:complete len:559 (-),score=111.32 TRINITY_DN1699_c0_g1_i2:64-1590(-)
MSAAMHNSSAKIALIEPTQNIGGMSYAGGIGLRDLNTVWTLDNTIASRWTLMNAKHYGVTYPVYQPDMPIGAQNFFGLLQTVPNVKLFLNTTLAEKGGVTKSGTTISSITTTTSGSSVQTQWHASVFVDATYEGDIVRFSGASYTYGRESRTMYNESYAGVRAYTTTGNFPEKSPVPIEANDQFIPYVDTELLMPVGSADDRMMGYSYRLCITPTKSKQAPFFAPPNYNRNDFILLQRYLDALANEGVTPGLGNLVDVLIYRSYPPGDKFDMCDSASSAFTSDAINLNKGYVDGSYSDRDTIRRQTLYYVLGQIYYLATDHAVPAATRNSTLKYGLCNDQWPENNHIPPLMYVREGLRLIGDRVFTQRDVNPGTCLPDSIAIGSWDYDIHVVSRTAVKSANGTLVANNEGQLFTGLGGEGQVYDVPISILLPKKSQITNLIVPVCNSASHVSYASVRVEPTFMQLGESSGVLAALASGRGAAVQDVPASDVQAALAKRGIKYHCKDTC